MYFLVHLRVNQPLLLVLNIIEEAVIGGSLKKTTCRFQHCLDAVPVILLVDFDLGSESSCSRCDQSLENKATNASFAMK